MKTEREAKRKLVKPNRRKSFDQILLEVIDEALSSLGENVKATVYSNLEGFYNLRKEDIPSRLSDFSGALEQIFGLGARYIEILFMKKLHTKTEVNCKWLTYKWPLSKWIVPEMTFQEYVRLMRQSFKARNAHTIQMGFASYEQEELQK